MSGLPTRPDDALRQYLGNLPVADRDAIFFDRWGDGQRVADRFEVRLDEVRALCRDLDKAEAAAGFKLLKTWHDAVLIHRELSATEKVAALRVWSFVNREHLYAWPSQERLAKELGYSRGPNLGKALKRSFEIGAYSPVRVKNLPAEVRDEAVTRSRRALRGIAYRLNPVERWSQEAINFIALQKSNMFHGGTLEGSMPHHLNNLENHIPSSRDSSSLREVRNTSTALPGGTVPLNDEGMIQSDICSSEHRTYARASNG